MTKIVPWIIDPHLGVSAGYGALTLIFHGGVDVHDHLVLGVRRSVRWVWAEWTRPVARVGAGFHGPGLGVAVEWVGGLAG